MKKLSIYLAVKHHIRHVLSWKDPTAQEIDLVRKKLKVLESLLTKVTIQPDVRDKRLAVLRKLDVVGPESMGDLEDRLRDFLPGTVYPGWDRGDEDKDPALKRVVLWTENLLKQIRSLRRLKKEVRTRIADQVRTEVETWLAKHNGKIVSTVKKLSTTSEFFYAFRVYLPTYKNGEQYLVVTTSYGRWVYYLDVGAILPPWGWDQSWSRSLSELAQREHL